jgi:hypothetical protein
MESTTEPKKPRSPEGVGAGQISLPYKEFIGRVLCKLVTGFSIISTDHSNQAKGHFCELKGFLNTFINNKPFFVSEVVIFRNTYRRAESIYKTGGDIF